MAPFRISRDRNPLDDTSLCIVVLVLLVLVARREVPFGRLRTHLRPLELKTSHTRRRRRKKEKEKTLLRFFCVMSKCMYLHIRHAHDDGEYYSSKSERTRQQKRRRLRGGPLFFLPSFASERERERERVYFSRVFFCVKTSSDTIEKTLVF